ncbi:ABC transporter permease [Mesorhizobium sp. L-8-10]|uniref:ABC transporter permease n=1 Tax=Mesorhizobium sp. L-8-10 TaxID=2744523 RepID=UPI001925B678|nr:ABC transporter permease [Mesorhizobium sp. L-8-10]BCH29875.1 ABC transporter permease [Mesorhizobium sp. L-8-10]
MTTSISSWRFWSLSFCAWILVGFLFLPLVILVPASLTDQTYLSLPQEHISFQHYKAVYTNSRWLSAIGQTFVIAFCSAVLATVIGGLAAIACWRHPRSVWSWIVGGLTLCPLMIPPVVSAVGFYRVWADLGWLDSYIGVIFAFTIKTLPYTFTPIAASLSLFDNRLEQAARNLGSNQMSAIWHVVVPAARPGIISGLLFAFVYVWDEIVILLFITNRQIRLLSRLIWEGLRDNVHPSIAVVSASLTLLTIVVVLIVLQIQKGRSA